STATSRKFADERDTNNPNPPRKLKAGKSCCPANSSGCCELICAKVSAVLLAREALVRQPTLWPSQVAQTRSGVTSRMSLCQGPGGAPWTDGQRSGFNPSASQSIGAPS